ncbi:GNAT family N-acetyltransferase [Agrococcus sp. HG114]|uniref:GNAT family N-acetyltransferase n=1 Tax=Agrococcus sp. HG114 TaxID=2969757 RepID=UPI00215A75FD|nr:GNAT family N-acetyltransferase [Agrococcus sp. HG114]MCR8671324.1 GNAT family N-acetyltransferase [Agrococcus sp. HG114]
MAASHLRRQEAGEALFLVALEDGEPLGSSVLVPGDVPELRHLFVAEAARGRGVGASLIGAAEREAAAMGATLVELGVSVDNPRAAALYRRLGYAETGERSTTTYEYVDRDGVRRTATETDVPMRKRLRG